MLLSGLILAGLIARFSAGMGHDVRAVQFTNWLETLAVEGQSELVRSTVDELRKGHISFDETVRRASEVIALQSGVFQLPIDAADSDQNRIRVVLLEQWSLHNQSGGMGKAATVEQTRSWFNTHPDKYVKLLPGLSGHKAMVYQPGRRLLQTAGEAVVFAVKPLINSCAINAP